MTLNSHSHEPTRSAPLPAKGRSNLRKAIPVAVLTAGLLAFGMVNAAAATASTAPAFSAGATITVEPSNADTAFLKTVQEHSFWAKAPDNGLIDVGHMVCQALDQGATMKDFVTANRKVPANEVEWVVGAAVGAYCPNHVDRISGSSEATAAYEKAQKG